MLKPRPLLFDFRVQLPVYQGSQDHAINWLAQAHARAETYSDNHLNNHNNGYHELAARMEKLVRRFGCSPDHIGSRRSELEDFLHTDWERMQIFNFSESSHGSSLGRRNQFFAEKANNAVSRFYQDEAAPPADLLHISCTGYASPSAIQRLIDQRGWHQHTRATQVYHMGCYAAIPALRVAAGLLVNPQNGTPPRADLIHTELCTLHFNPADHAPEQLVVQSLFADGHIRYSMIPDNERGESLPAAAFEILSVREETVPDTLEEMTWVLSEWGFRMTLSRKVPERIAAALPGFLSRLFVQADESYQERRAETQFAIHPGGPRIIDSVQQLLELSETQTRLSRAVLFERGNMSSATLPHVWTRMLADEEIKPDTLIASLAFGPGLTIAGALFKKL